MTQPTSRAGRVTSADVAAASGVSRATVSYVLNRVTNQSIPEATKQRVLEAAHQLGYVRSAVGSALRKGRSELVLLDTTGMPSGFDAKEYIRAFSSKVRASGATVLEHWSTEGREELEAVVAAAAPFAVPTSLPLASSQVNYLRAAGVELISGIDFAQQRNLRQPLAASAGRLQVEYLSRRNPSRFGYVRAVGDGLPLSTVLRLEGYLKECEARQVAPVVMESSDDIGVLAARLKDAVKAGVDALATTDDETAFRVLAALSHLRIAVPEQVSVMGVDDIPLARFAIPPLTTLRLDVRTLGESLAIDLLGAMGRDVPALDIESLNYEVIVRSTA